MPETVPYDREGPTLPPPEPLSSQKMERRGKPASVSWLRIVTKLFYGLCLTILGCVSFLRSPISNNPTGSPVSQLGPGREVVLWVDPTFSSQNQRVITDGYATREILEHLGVTVVYSRNGQQDRPTTSDRVNGTGTPIVFVYNWLNTNPDSNVLGLYPLTRNRVYLDETRINSPRMFRTVFLHEFGHWAGLRHVCLTVQEMAVPSHECTPGIIGPAIMNPGVSDNSPEGYTSLDDEERRLRYNLPVEPTRSWDRDLGVMPEDATVTPAPTP